MLTCRPGVNVQLFTGTIGGAAPPPVISGTGERPFSVDGDTFVGVAAARGRACDKQHNACANAANSGAIAGGVQQCDAQNILCKSVNNLRKRAAPAPRAALDLGTCSDASIVFEEGLDGRNQAAFIAANQGDFQHGSALAIGVIAGFICQRLGSPCGAPADVQASCTAASIAAVATTQNQAAADVFNAILGGGGGVAAAVEPPAQTKAAQAPKQTAAAAGKDEGKKDKDQKDKDEEKKKGKNEEKKKAEDAKKKAENEKKKAKDEKKKAEDEGKKNDGKNGDKGKEKNKGHNKAHNKGKGGKGGKPVKTLPAECAVPSATAYQPPSQVVGAVVVTITSCV